ncbi:hypothetical protein [Parathalassolituus penaei]|uniref:Big-1 domain-containing protein n=1 Tax=Parathalassolituus penaei TaxID=2997323 RepID=A0A9X3EGY2_9GAMM|nr:hypothetical protein [Parathalassolituus penaei]MCY0967362.1 hypothetical protein [Parathalassolituus penaei]
MSKSGLLTSLLLTLALTACGGGGPVAGSSSDSGTDTGTDTGTDPDVEIALGAGSGSAFDEGGLTLSATNVLIGDSLTVAVSAVDKNDSNSLITDNYQYVFSSTCASASTPTARFTTVSTFNSTGSVTSTYINEGCTGSDTITAELYEASATLGVDSPVASASAVVSAVAPQLGSGTGVDYQDAVIGGTLALVGTSSTVLSANAVNPADANSLVSSNKYSISWSSSCADGAFSISSQNLSAGAFETRYDGNLTSCLGAQTITLKLYRTAAPTVVLDTTTTIVNIATSDSGEELVVPSIGTGTGSSFREGALSFSMSKALTGDDVTIAVSGVDKNSENTSLSSSYKYVFSSDCVAAGNAEMTVLSSTNANGSATSIYRSTKPACTGSDTVRVFLYAATAVVGTDAPLASASGSLELAVPVLGSNSGSSFRDGVIAGTTDLSGLEETVLSATVVNPLDSNSLAGNDDYLATWAASCGSFSVSSQSVSSGSIETRYDVPLASCEGDNTVTLTLSYKGITLDTASVTVVVSEEANSDVEIALGSGSGADFYEGRLGLSESQILAGGSLTVDVSAVNKLDSNALLTDAYLYIFSASCSGDGSGEFSIPRTVSSSGSVTSTYRNLTCDGGAAITVELFRASADTSTATPLATASATIDTAKPALGVGSGSAFIDDSVSGVVTLSGEDETEFSVNLVNPLDSNSLVSDEDYIAEWFSSCGDSSFSVQKQVVSAGVITTRYTTDLDTCVSSGSDSNNEITLVVYERNNPCSATSTSACLDTKTFDVTVNEGLAPTLGVVDGGTFYTGQLLVNNVREIEYDTMTDAQKDAAKLSARGTMLIVANVGDANNSYETISGTAYGMTISSDCVQDGTASFDATEKTSTSGTITFTYTSDICEEDHFEVNLYKVVDGAMTTLLSSTPATGTIYIHPIQIGAITYSGASATAISIASIGDAVLPKLTTLTFAVVDESNNPVVGKQVDFTLNNTTGGIYLAAAYDVTDSNGEVTAILNAGTSHAITSVRAAVETDDGETIYTSSQPISVTTGIPDQDSFDIAVDTFNPAAYNENGVTVTVTAYAADQYQNPVADGTVVNFTAESGQIESYCTTSSGSCSVTWTSSGTRPGKHAAGLQRVNDKDPQARKYDSFILDSACDESANTNATICGMTTITAYTQGEGGFTDTDGDGLFNGTEPFVKYAEAIRDDNWSFYVNGVDAPDENTDGQPVEFFADFNTDGLFTVAPTVYQGAVCTTAAKAAGHCAEMMHVRDSIRIVQSYNEAPNMRLYTYDGATYTEVSGITLDAINGGTFYVFLQDLNGNMPASGTTFSASGDGYKIFGDSGDVGNSIGLRADCSNAACPDIGLPTFGRLYRVSYAPDGIPVSVTVTGTLDSSSTSIQLN